ncbi:MAG: DUF6599 family protein [Candidatus Aminicenantes bacterium]
MLKKSIRKVAGTAGVFLLAASLSWGGFLRDGQEGEDLKSLLPDISGWKMMEEPRYYLPESLFEYINGAAESYLSYDFQKLVVVQYEIEDGGSNVSLEIYDMEKPLKAFGIYSAERFPDNRFVDIGTQGYLEEGILNFLAGRYYVKMLCFDCGEDWSDYLKTFAGRIEEKIGGEFEFPAPAKAFPDENLIANSQKFILENFMGYGYLHSGYQADYEINGNEFTAFIIQGTDEEDAQHMLEQYLDSKKDQKTGQTDAVHHIKDRYYHNIYITRTGSYVCGAMKIQDGMEDTGKSYLDSLAENIKKL